MEIGRLNERVRIERKSVSQDASYGTEVVTWTTLATVWANVEDVLPSRAENTRGIRIENRPARVRMRYRTDVTSDMRLVMMDRASLVMQIVSGPAQIGRRHGLELMAESYTTAGVAP
jgi:SPP1 family predicted phage head-tail adaptor